MTPVVTPEPTSPGPAPKPRKGGIVVPNRPRWHQRLVALLIFAIERAVIATLRVKWDDRAGLAADAFSGPVIFSLWHNRLALSMCIWRNYVRRHLHGRGLAALISASKDGALLAAVLEQFDVQAVRGSSSRRGPQALLELTSWLERNCNLAITPDGPRGPCYVMQPGVIALAQVTGAPIIPVACHMRWRLTLRSWDKFQIPLPFARCEIVFGSPVFIPREATDAEREELRKKLEAEMRAITKD